MVQTNLFQLCLLKPQVKRLSNMLIGLLILALAYAGYKIAKSSNNTTYGSSLEHYITSRNPQHSGDVERLTVEYNMKVSKGVL